MHQYIQSFYSGYLRFETIQLVNEIEMVHLQQAIDTALDNRDEETFRKLMEYANQ